jgi:hypothetical protein
MASPSASAPSDLVDVVYVVLDADDDDAVLECGEIEVPRSAIRPQASGLGVLEWEGHEYSVIHYADPEVSGGEEWYEVERVGRAAASAMAGVPWAGSDPAPIQVCLQSRHYDPLSPGGERWHEQSAEVLESAIFYKDNHLRLIHDGHEYRSFEPSFNIWRRQAGEDEIHPDDLAALGLPEAAAGAAAE